ncbi:MAG: polymer-forming cytoskeletal protein [Deltaproteobacteria bacterium]|jgi:cytoskeletal protein CcmA (bactofilin family)|nr:polymer-forming cytoskeletal protein [Deltaproteobacteria bacterium]
MAKHEAADGKINGLIDRGCSMEGRLTFDGAVQINGDFRGDIISDGMLVIGPEAKVEGNIQVGAMIIEGNVEGVVEIKDKVELRRGAKLVASINTPSIVIEEGATFQGQCIMLPDSRVDVAGDQVVMQQEVSSAEEGDSLMM